MTKKEKEKIESKGAYSSDLHDAIRDVRQSIGRRDHPSVVQAKLNSLYDILAPEIREAVDSRWELKFNTWDESKDRLENLSKKVVYRLSIDGYEDSPWIFGYDRNAWEKYHEVTDGPDAWEYIDEIYRVSDGEEEFYFEDGGEADEKLEEIKEELEEKTPDNDDDKYFELRELFRLIIDVLDDHGELRKWRDVEYGKV